MRAQVGLGGVSREQRLVLVLVFAACQERLGHFRTDPPPSAIAAAVRELAPDGVNALIDLVNYAPGLGATSLRPPRR